MKRFGLILSVLLLTCLLSITSYAQPIPGTYDSRLGHFPAGEWSETLVGGSEGAEGNVINAKAAGFYLFGDTSAPALSDVILIGTPTGENRFYEYRTVYKGGALTLINNAGAGWFNVSDVVTTPYQVTLDNTLVVTKKYVDSNGALTGAIEFALFVVDAGIEGYPGYKVTLTAKYDKGTPTVVPNSNPIMYGGPLSWAVITITSETRPIAVCQDVTVVAGSNCTASASIDNGSYDPDGDPVTLTQSPPGPYQLGTTPVTLTATDSKGFSSQCTGEVTVVDKTPPVITMASANPSVLWPPNHKMVNVTINYNDTDNCQQLSCQISSVTSNEPISSSDYAIVDAHHVKLNAERLGSGNGRIYTITITCTDTSGNSSSQSVTVTVPHDQGKQ